LCQKQSHEKKRWSSLDYWNCKWDLNHALDISAKKMKWVNTIPQMSLGNYLTIHEIREM
jgi:hypothetical protein